MHIARRNDIQGLRAVAVLLVVAYHLRPSLLPGGFIGVDVFFVISGFLITTSLVREALGTGRINLPAFWMRRVRRLLPAASAVLVAVLLAGAVLLPWINWPTLVSNAFASAFSFENWLLAASSVDYLNADTTPVPTRHFWSLSVEEQFYIALPILLACLAAIARTGGRLRERHIGIVLAALFAASLMWSVIGTITDPATAYYSTATRAWELLAGALLALVAPRLRLPEWAALTALIGGLSAILLSVALITESTPFPGIAASLPVAGAVAVIAAGSGGSRTDFATRLLSARPMAFIGDVSYGIYLWHWPLIVYTTVVLGSPDIPAALCLAIVLAAVGLGALSRSLLERPTPRAMRSGSARRHSALLASIAMVSVVAIGTSMLVGFRTQLDELAKASAPENFPGARIFEPGFDPSDWNMSATDPAPLPQSEFSPPYQLDGSCLATIESDDLLTCKGGDSAGKIRVLLAGDSHASQWFPMVSEVGRLSGWDVTVAAKIRCPLTKEPQIYADVPGWRYSACESWNRKLADYIEKSNFDLVVTGALRYDYLPAFDDEGQDEASWRADAVEGTFEAWRDIIDQGTPIVAVREVPRFPMAVRDCMYRPSATIDSCSAPLAELGGAMPTTFDLALEREPRATLLDPVPLICPDRICRPVVGNVFTFNDDTHVSEPFAQSMGWVLYDLLRADHPNLIIGTGHPPLGPEPPGPPAKRQ